MLYGLFIQFCYLAIWSIVLAGGVILLRRGCAHSAMSVLLGAGILLLMEVLSILMMVLRHVGVMEGPAMSRVSQLLWVPQLLGGFLFALGFLQVARQTQREN
jgi:hypothetical protein